MDAQTLLQMMSGLKPQDVSKAVGDMRRGRFRNAEVLEGSGGIGPKVVMPLVMKNGMKLLTKINSVPTSKETLNLIRNQRQVPNAMGQRGTSSMNVDVVKAADWSEMTGDSGKTIWEVVNKLASRNKTGKAADWALEGKQTYLKSRKKF